MENYNGCINEKYSQLISTFSTQYRSDIYRKFEAQFISCFRSNINIPSDIYVEQSTNEYDNTMNIFVNSTVSDIKFILGYTGVGKTTFLKHYLDYRTNGFKVRDDTIIIPSSWDGMIVPENDYVNYIDNQIVNIIDNLMLQLYRSYEELIVNESTEIINYIIGHKRSDLLASLTIQEILDNNKYGISMEQAKIQKSKDINKVAMSSALLQYVLECKKTNIKKLIFIIDDLETLSQKKLCYLVDRFLHIYDCLHNAEKMPIIKLIISLRPHSFRYLRKDLPHQKASAYGDFLDDESYRMYKNTIPDVKEILFSRFNKAFESENPKNPETWRMAKESFYRLINGFDENIINTIGELCHMNIRAIIDCMHMILSNRIWCQNNTPPSDHFTVKDSEYRFDVVNVIRTLACGECPVYTGTKELKFNQKNYSNVLARPKFDDSTVFIPNIFINLETKECDVLTVIVMQYLDGYFSSKASSAPQTEFIKKTTLCSNLTRAFGQKVSTDRINCVIDYLFENRIIRKSIISKDNDDTIGVLSDDDYIYLTLKGSRILQMLENDSVLLEIYREDIKRDYFDEECFSSAFELRNDNKRHVLFRDLISLIREIFENESHYQDLIKLDSLKMFYDKNFPITTKLIAGVQSSINRSQSIDADIYDELINEINCLRDDVNKRINEIS